MAIYGSSKKDERKELWDEWKRLESSVEGEWLLGGDDIMCASKKGEEPLLVRGNEEM